MKNKLKSALLITLCLLLCLTAATGCEMGSSLIKVLTKNCPYPHANVTGKISVPLDERSVLGYYMFSGFNGINLYPDEFFIGVDGKISGTGEKISLTLTVGDGETSQSMQILRNNNMYYIQLCEATRIINGLLCSIQSVSYYMSQCMSDAAMEFGSDGTKFLAVDADVFDRIYRGDIGDDANMIIQVIEELAAGKALSYSRCDEFEVAEPSQEKLIPFNSIYKSYRQELVKNPFYQANYMDIVLCSDEEDGQVYFNSMTWYNNYDMIRDKIAADIDLATAGESREKVLSSNILPLRFIAESFGYEIRWDAEKMTAYVISGDNVYTVEGELIGDLTFINPAFFLILGLDAKIVYSGEIIEIVIQRIYE